MESKNIWHYRVLQEYNEDNMITANLDTGLMQQTMDSLVMQ